MPQKRAAAKALRQNKKLYVKNSALKEKIKETIKKYKKAVETKKEDIAETLKEVYSILDKAAKVHLIHPNKASRRKSRLTKLAVKAAGQSASQKASQ